MFIWPLRGASAQTIGRPFDPPERPWMAGHRGVDILIDDGGARGEDLLAPADGIIAFAGKVGGKDVVSLAHEGSMTTSYEPAVTDLPAGTRVGRGGVFARIGVHSDHCADVASPCVHWGVRRGGDYVDPVALTIARRIGLKPSS